MTLISLNVARDPKSRASTWRHSHPGPYFSVKKVRFAIFKKSALKLQSSISSLRTFATKWLYKTTAGIAAAKPMAVVIRASTEIPGATTAKEALPVAPILKASHDSPNRSKRPMKALCFLWSQAEVRWLSKEVRCQWTSIELVPDCLHPTKKEDCSDFSRLMGDSPGVSSRDILLLKREKDCFSQNEGDLQIRTLRIYFSRNLPKLFIGCS